MDSQDVKKTNTKARAFSVGKRRVPADEFAAASACENLQIDLNSATLEQLEQASKKRFPNFKLEDSLEEFAMNETTVVLSPVETRAVVLLRLITFLQGRACVRPQIAEFLGEIVSRNVLPRLPSLAVATDKQIMTVFVNAIRLDGEYKTRLEAAKIVIPELNGNEIHKFTMGITVSQALFILASATSRVLCKLNDAYSGLSLEVISAFSEPFQTTYYDNAHAYTSAVEVASTLRWLNEGSTLVNKSKRKTADLGCFRYIPITNGTFRDATTASTLVSRVDLNAAEAAGHINDWQHNPALVRNYLEQSGKTLIHATNELITACLARIQFIISNINEFGPLNVDSELAKQEITYISSEIVNFKSIQEAINVSEYDIIATLSNLVSTCLSVVQLEGFMCSQILKARDITAQEAAIQAQEAKKVALEQRIAKLLAEGKVELAETMKQSQNKKDTPGGAVKGLVIGFGATIINTTLPTDARTPLVMLLSANSDILNNVNFLEGLSRSVSPVNQTFMPKLPKGTRDSNPQLMAVREKAFDIITKVFQKHGGVGIDTPVFERRETLMGKYGEDSKLIYDLADQGGEILSLRYDLTVPFARFCATNGITNIKRYHIAKVYRRDNPVMNKGRFREFFQCDYDVAGVYPPMIADAEVIKVMCDILSTLDLGEFKIKLSHRKLLDGILTIAGVPADKLRPICSAVDKLDKEPWSVVKDEMCNEKGLPEEIADKLEKYVTIPANEPFTLLAHIKQDVGLNNNPSAREAFDELTLLFEYLDAMKALQYISFDLSLARGLDYYTGIIYEAVLLDPTVAVGSIGAGGRYDNLVGMFSGRNVPAVGVSIGLERIMAILEKRELDKFGFIKATKTKVLVASVGNNLLKDRMIISSELWAQDIPAEFLYLENPNIRKQMEYAFDNAIPLVAWIGEDELKNNVVSVKTLSSNKDDQTEAVTVPRAELAAYINKVLA